MSLDLSLVRSEEPVVASRPRRLMMSVARRWRASIARLSHPGATFGAGCDIRSGLHMTIYGAGPRVEFGDRCVLDRHMTLECTGRGEIIVGARTIFGHHCTLAATTQIRIGEDCLIAEMVAIRDHDHRFDDVEQPIRVQGSVSSPVIIANNVWLASKVTVLKGVSIGEGAIIGANSVVTRDIPAGAIAVGAPAKVLRLR